MLLWTTVYDKYSEIIVCVFAVQKHDEPYTAATDSERGRDELAKLTECSSVDDVVGITGTCCSCSDSRGKHAAGETRYITARPSTHHSSSGQPRCG